jgi:hypothetical protein
LLNHSFGGRVVRKVRFNNCGAIPEAGVEITFDSVPRGVRGTRYDDHLRAPGNEPTKRGTADTPRPAGEDDDLAVKTGA